MANKPIKIEIYTDGACKPNPGKGGWAAIILVNGVHTISKYGHDPDSTNNRMELLAPISGLLHVQQLKVPLDITIYSDSKYVINSMTEWADKWEKKRYAGVKNPDLIIQLHTLCKTMKPKWKWVKGHNGDLWNEVADQLAGSARYNQITGEAL